ncbi:MAG TPA: SIS domain-containing protein [Gemmatimonadales bacterium]|nr:SIS domain-containing protein [Gemmatimonadales bacterium]
MSAPLGHLEELARVAARSAAVLAEPVARYVGLVQGTLAAGRTVYFAGNGGSAAHAQHIATEYVVRYRPRERRAAPALALSTDSSLLTAAANDLGFEHIFARQIEAHGRPGDLLVLISTSGRSANLVRAAEAAKAAGVRTVALLAADGGALAKLVDVAVVVPCEDAAHAQEVQLAVDHYVCSQVEPGLK